MSPATGVYRAEWVLVRKSSFTFSDLASVISIFSGAKLC